MKQSKRFLADYGPPAVFFLLILASISIWSEHVTPRPPIQAATNAVSWQSRITADLNNHPASMQAAGEFGFIARTNIALRAAKKIGYLGGKPAELN